VSWVRVGYTGRTLRESQEVPNNNILRRTGDKEAQGAQGPIGEVPGMSKIMISWKSLND